MLYVTTKNKTDSYTAYRVLHEEKILNEGFFAPFHLPVLDPTEIESLKEQNFSEIVAKILNLFFSRRITSWDVEFAIGRYPFRTENIGQRVVVAELWHNNQSSYDYIVTNLYKKLSDQPCKPVPMWVCIAIEIAVLFGLYGELLRSGITCADIAVTDDVMHYPIAAWYARKMGLPIGKILCGCNERSGLWDFLRKGEAAVNMPEEMQLLVFENFGVDEAVRFSEVRKNGRIYRLSDEQTGFLNDGIYPSVIGSERVSAVTASIQRNSGYCADALTSAAYGAIQDYRAATGENCPTLLLSRQKPKE